MAISLQENSAECDLDQIVRYLDRDLSDDSQLQFESHLADCGSCKTILNREKQILIAVRDAELVADIPALPDDFAHRVSVAAANDIGTIQLPSERLVAIAICGLLGLFALAALGGSLTGFAGTIDGAFALVSILVNLLYRIAFGLTAFLRPFSHYLDGNNWGPLTGFLVVLVLAYLYFHRRLRTSRGS